MDFMCTAAATRSQFEYKIIASMADLYEAFSVIELKHK